MKQQTAFKVDDWSKLNSRKNPIIASIANRWNLLLQQKNVEEVYQKFLSEHAGLFMSRDLQHETIVISKLRLGANHVVDFVKTIDRHSAGLQYVFMEIETPWSPPYTKKGKPSSRLTEAIQQIQDWRAWIRNNKPEFQRLFPFYNAGIVRDERIRFMIVIGTTENSAPWLERRNQISEDLEILIRSFDYFSYNLRDRCFREMVRPHLVEGCDFIQQISLANPFFEAYSDHTWRSLALSYRNHRRHDELASLLLNHRTYNKSLGYFHRKYPLISARALFERLFDEDSKNFRKG